jgi:hypothetical protein
MRSRRIKRVLRPLNLLSPFGWQVVACLILGPWAAYVAIAAQVNL